MGRAEVACQRVGGWGGGCARDVVGGRVKDMVGGGGGSGNLGDIGGIREGVGRGLRRLRVVAGG